ncbi:hypothetical protein [Waddlia chondrophila]|uniref:hypothetical protein n=1 Tax=Waddlia chondrophila TaxID=71667 RepID=UPI0005A55251|nr:hypothetical protein [Waddlia chondrophila]
MNIFNFRIDISGDLEYEDLVADIYFKDEFVAMLTQEKGYENLEIDIYPPKFKEAWHFNYSEFEQALKYAKDRLWELRKLPEE